MNISLSNMISIGVWTAFLSVLAIIGIIVAGGFIVSLVGKMMLSLIDIKKDENVNVDEFGYSQSYNNENAYITQSEEFQRVNTNVNQNVNLNAADDYSYALDVDENQAISEESALKNEMSKQLNALVGKVPGLLSVQFVSNPLASSTHEIALVTTLEKAEDIAVYATHPEHVKVADLYVRPYVTNRACLDY